MSKKKFDKAQLIIFGIITLMGVPLGMMAGVGFVKPEIISTIFNGPLSIIFILLSFCLSLFLIIFTHELGHVLGGQLAGHNFIMFTVGPLKFYKKERGIGFELNKSAAGFGGLTISLPRTKNLTTASLIPYIAGGVTVNFLTLLICSLLFIFYRSDLNSDLNFFIFTLGYLSIIALLQNAIPFTINGMMNDGKQAMVFYKGGRRAEMRKLLFKVSSLLMAGIRPSELPEETIEELKAASVFDSVEEYSVKINLYERALDKKDYETAKEINDDILFLRHSLPAFLHSGIMYEDLFVRMVTGSPVDDYEEQMKVTAKLPSYFDPIIRFRVQSLYNLKKGNYEKAIKSAEEGLKHLDKHFNRGNAVMQKEIMEEIIKEANLGDGDKNIKNIT